MWKPKPKKQTVRNGSVTVKIYPTKTASGQAWSVCWYEDGTRHKVQRSTFAKAKAVAEEHAERLNDGSVGSMSITQADRLEYAQARSLLLPSGRTVGQVAADYADSLKSLSALPGAPTLADAVEDYIRRHPANVPTMSVAAVVSELIETRRQDGCGPRHITDLEQRLTRFADDFKTNLCNVDGLAVDRWLRNLKKKDGKPVKPRTRNNFRGQIANLFSFAKRRGYLPPDNAEFAKVERAKEPEEEIEIFSPFEIHLWLSAASEHYPKLVPLLALGAFAGLRTSEIERLRWEHIQWESEVVAVPANTKTGRRLAPLLPNAREWLWTHRKRGKVHAYQNTPNAITRMVKRVNSARTEDGLDLVAWKHNAMRHSFASYRLAELQNAAQVSEECGHTVAQLRKHYREVVTSEQAKEWFNVMPEAGKRIIKPKFK